MKVINPSFEIYDGDISEGGLRELQKIERIGRSCWDSEDKITADGESAKKFVKMLISRGHESPLEHVNITVKFICDRGISHEIVRHRHSAYTQQSTRYCNFANADKYPDGMLVIKPCYFADNSTDFRNWWMACQDSEFWYLQLIKCGWKPQDARGVLPTSLATKLYMTAGLREWRRVLDLRCDKAAHPQIRELMIPLGKEFQKRIPVVFDDIMEKYTDKENEDA